MAKGPVLIEDDTSDPVSADAPPARTVPTGAAMQTVAAIARPRKSVLGRWFGALDRRIGPSRPYRNTVTGLWPKSNLATWLRPSGALLFVLRHRSA